ncbi:Dabb family protein [Variovorax sp. AFSI2.2]|uniref:Dabb family protein n=1 Tax=Variovorax sp. AFSI2.2 TaxID=3384160 RepID=UPI003EBCCCAB
MIRHIVMWDVSGDTAEEKQRNMDCIQSGFHGLRGSVPGLLHLEIGVDASNVDYACDVVLYSEFESWEALAAYAVHPEHLRVRDELAGVRIARHQVDYEVRAGRAWAEHDAAGIA